MGDLIKTESYCELCVCRIKGCGLQHGSQLCSENRGHYQLSSIDNAALNGEIIYTGTIPIGGEVLTGVFIECTKEEMMKKKPMVYSKVSVWQHEC